MKNLILTLTLVISSLVCYSQLQINISIGNKDTILLYTANDDKQLNTHELYYNTGDLLSVIPVDPENDDLIFIAVAKPGPPNAMTGLYANIEGTTDSISVIGTDVVVIDSVLDIIGNDFYIMMKMSDATLWVHLIDSSTASINDLELTTTRLSAYPNPASSNITIDFDVTTNEVPVAIFSMSGQLVYSNNDNRNNGTNSLNVDVSGFQTGIYIVKAGSQTFKFVKQ